MEKYRNDLNKAREEKDYQAEQKRIAAEENNNKRKAITTIEEDIKNLGEQINSFYEKFGEAQNELVEYQEEYENIKLEQNKTDNVAADT